MPFKPLYLLCFALLFLQCNHIPRQVQPAFYHWQTRLEFSSSEKTYLNLLKVQRIYTKFFDVDWDTDRQQAVPLALIDIQAVGMEAFEIIPTIFITNRTLLNIKEAELQNLAQKMVAKIQELYQPLNQIPFKEIQLDCDWSLQTKDKYFALIRHIEKEFLSKNVQLSATIRLHQVKFFEKTGVPPVQKGMLMFYNMGDVSDISTENSILDMRIAEQYFTNFDRYPLALDIALPIFAWGVLMRDDQMIKLINNLRTEALADTSRFFKVKENLFQVTKNTYLDGYYLYEEDQIRLEQVSVEDLEVAAKKLNGLVTHQNLTLAFYHLDTTVIKHYPYENLEKIYQSFAD